jgi:protein-S-isoprenylcysteine O-methyltransferase Ste14
VREFARARTTVNPLAPARASRLVTGGVFAHTRNPMYLGMLLVLAGWGVWLGNALAWLGLPLFVGLLNALQIGPEERAMRQRFGADFDRYAAQVRRWL